MKKTTKKAAKKLTNIDRLILLLGNRMRWQGLCPVGQERLKWWKKNRNKFSSIKAACATWTPQQVLAFTEFAEIDLDLDCDVRDLIEDGVTKCYVSRELWAVVPDELDSEVTNIIQEANQKIIKLLKRRFNTVSLLKRVTEKQLTPTSSISVFGGLRWDFYNR